MRLSLNSGLLFWALLLSCVWLTAVTSLAHAQHTEYLPFYSGESSALTRLARERKESITNHFTIPQDAGAKYRHSYESIVKEQATDVYHLIRNTALLDSVADPFIQEIFQNIVSANTGLPAARLILTRSPHANAFALADGTIFFNIGLLSLLENESQVAFVLCHELAHAQLRHTEKSIKENLDVLYSKGFKKQYKQIVRQGYNVNSRLISLVMGRSLNYLHQKRSFEKQADSLGYVLLSKTKYDLNAAYTALGQLDMADEPWSSKEVNLEKYFGCTGHSFKKEPVRKTSIFEISAPEHGLDENSDTLKTHPDCKKRMLFIKELAQSFPPRPETVSPVHSQMEKLTDVSRREVIQSYFDFKHYDLALFYSLLSLEDQPASHYLRNMVVMCLFEIKKHLQRHEFAQIVTVASEANPRNFNLLLTALHDLDLSDYKGISACFIASYASGVGSDEYSFAGKYAAQMLLGETAAAETTKKEYRARYAEGRFLGSVFSDQ